MEVTNLTNLTARRVRRCFGPTEKPFFTEVLCTQDAKKNAYELILEQVFEVIPAFNLISDPASMAAFKDWVARQLYEGIAIGCYSLQGELVAVDFLSRQKISVNPVPPSKLIGELFYNFTKYLHIFHDKVRAKCRQIDPNSSYLTSHGVFTKPAYKYQGIQKEMINMRKDVARAFGIQVLASAFIEEEIQEEEDFNQEEVTTLLRLHVTCEEVFPIQIMGVIKTRAHGFACI